MRFSIGLIALTAATANALVPAPTLTLRLSDLTLIVTNLLGPVDKISTGSMVPFLSGNGPVYTLATDLTKGVQISSQLFSGSGFTSSDSLTHATTDPLLAAVVKLADSTTVLMNGISSKGNVFSSSPLVAIPVNAFIASTKNSFDNLLNAITAALATSSAAQDGTLNKAIASIATMDTAFQNALDATNVLST
ncbi:hypothetical protein BGZ61DRAFT_525370 [Ilyonectria robusta]|uniref:uncharacterized protein n=1 Tax=Ilyonectria robusta TaxID=1079257 RepID=UPI001E8D214F|nr:uncharacterized protein BGZ61DRAFT_525370 [Ilyonectria robusta]KAH8737199.1 hypothetical protein BGZ61DRAFT_525370 [Ilyonectria robusta]